MYPQFSIKEWFEKGKKHHLREEYDKAIEAYTNVLALNPNNAEAYDTYNNRGTAYAIKREYDRAIEDYTKAIALYPNNANNAQAYYGRGLCYSVKGDMKMAISDFQKACDLGLAAACEHLQRALQAKKDEPSAKNQVESNPNFINIWSTMVEHMDTGRYRWFAIQQEILVDHNIKIVNSGLNTDVDIGARKEILPKSFPFKYVSGYTLEAMLICWQIEMAALYILGQNYLAENQLGDFFASIASTVSTVSPKAQRWRAGGSICFKIDKSDYGEGLNFDTLEGVANDIALVMAYFLTNEREFSENISKIIPKINWCPSGMMFLGALTQLAVAIAFDDREEAQRIMSSVKT